VVGSCRACRGDIAWLSYCSLSSRYVDDCFTERIELRRIERCQATVGYAERESWEREPYITSARSTNFCPLRTTAPSCQIECKNTKRAGALVRDINPDTRILVSRTTRTLRSHCRDFSRDLLRCERAQLLNGAVQFSNHLSKSLATGLAFRRFQNDHVCTPSNRYGLAPSLDPGGGNHHAFFGVLHGFHRQSLRNIRTKYIMVLRTFRRQPEILWIARRSFVAAYSDSPIATVPAGPPPFNLARWIPPFLSSEAMECV